MPALFLQVDDPVFYSFSTKRRGMTPRPQVNFRNGAKPQLYLCADSSRSYVELLRVSLQFRTMTSSWMDDGPCDGRWCMFSQCPRWWQAVKYLHTAYTWYSWKGSGLTLCQLSFLKLIDPVIYSFSTKRRGMTPRPQVNLRNGAKPQLYLCTLASHEDPASRTYMYTLVLAMQARDREIKVPTGWLSKPTSTNI